MGLEDSFRVCILLLIVEPYFILKEALQLFDLRLDEGLTVGHTHVPFEHLVLALLLLGNLVGRCSQGLVPVTGFLVVLLCLFAPVGFDLELGLSRPVGLLDERVSTVSLPSVLEGAVRCA